MLTILKSEKLEAAGFGNHGFTCGVDFCGDDATSHLLELKKHTGETLPLARVIQVHGATVVSSDEAMKGSSHFECAPTVEADAIVSGESPAIMAVQTADCVPILLACPDTHGVSVIHAGWKGLDTGVVRSAVKALMHRGADPYKMLAAIGPHICESCYEVGEEVARKFPESHEPIRKKPGKYSLDLGWAAEAALIGAGLTSSNFDNLKICTACGDQHLFSYRKSGGDCGRQLSYIAG